MSIVTPVDVAVAVGENDPGSPLKTYTFYNVKGRDGKLATEISVTFNNDWAPYWTDDRRVCPPPPDPTLFTTIMGIICLPIALVLRLAKYIAMGIFAIVVGILSVLWMPVTAAKNAWRYGKAPPVLTLDEFHYWLGRKGFTNEEMKKVKEATNGMTMHTLASTLTDVRDVEKLFKLQSIEKQKLVVGILQQSKEAIDKAHESKFQELRKRYTGAIFSWGTEDAYRLGDAIAKNGRMCSRGEDARKKADWQQRVASKVNLRVNAVLRCINTIANEGRFSSNDAKMSDLERTVNRSDNPPDWNEFVVDNKKHDNKLFDEIHTAAPYIKQYIAQAIVTESYARRVARICWSWTVLLVLVAFRLAKVVLRFEFDEIGDVIDLIVGTVTELAESPMDALDILENGLPTGSGGTGTNGNGLGGSIMNVVDDRFGRDARLENKEAQMKASMKCEKVTELVEE
ncbi:hypothetical protein PRNP1_003043 [Phytophthora ramorum]